MSVKNVAILLSNAIRVDSRVQKIVRTLSKHTNVDLFYINADPEDEQLFCENVRLFPINHKVTFRTKVIRHTCFYNEFNHLAQHVLSQSRSYDLIYCNDLPTLKAGVRIKRKTNARLVYDSHEIYVETLNQFFPQSRSWKSPLFKVNIALMRVLGAKVEQRLVRQTDHFITVNHRLANYFEQKYGVQNVLSVYNCPELESHGSKASIDFRKMFNWSDRDVILIYQGMMNPGRGLAKLVRSIKMVDEHFKLILIGYGTTKMKIRKLIDELQLDDRVKLLDFVPSDKLRQYSRGADIGVTFLQNLNISTNYATPNKLFEYIHADLYIISSDVPECAKIIDEHELGLTCGFSEEEISNAINNCEDKFEPHSQPENIDEVKRHFSWENQVSALLSILE